MSLHDQILEQSSNIDWTERIGSGPMSIIFPVPKSHPRSVQISTYPLTLSQLSNYHFLDTDLILCDENLKGRLKEQIVSLPNIFFLPCTESSLKTISGANAFLQNHQEQHWKRVLAIGGGILINFGGYVAEQLQIDLVYVPTSIIAMSDASIGGKVRLNTVKGSRFNKHAHKSFYEPSAIVLDPQFLEYMDDDHIRIGLAEVIKHAIYQSPKLTEYLLSEKFDPFKNRETLLRAILWSADLKRICLEVDPEESKEGAYRILRAAHDISDKLEERSEFTLSHGKAVEKAMIEDLHADTEKSSLLTRIYQKLGIGYTTVFS